MFCARCGQQIPEASETCPLCGRETTIRLQPAPGLQTAAPADSRLQPALTSPYGPQGMGGWLLLFCIGLTVLSPLLMISQFVSLGTRLNRGHLIDLVRVGYGMVVGILLWMRRNGALNLLKIYFVIVAIVTLLGVLSLLPIGLRTGWASVFMSRGFTPILHLAAYTIIWFSYFHKSRRVRNTYGANL